MSHLTRSASFLASATVAVALCLTPALAQVAPPVVNADSQSTTNTTQGNQQALTFNSSPVPGKQRFVTVPDAIAPSIGGGNPCVINGSVGVSGMGFGISGGLGVQDPECETRQQVALLVNMGAIDVAIARFCMEAEVREAFRLAGKPCPNDEQAAAAPASVRPAAVRPVAVAPAAVQPVAAQPVAVQPSPVQQVVAAPAEAPAEPKETSAPAKANSFKWDQADAAVATPVARPVQPVAEIAASTPEAVAADGFKWASEADATATPVAAASQLAPAPTATAQVAKTPKPVAEVITTSKDLTRDEITAERIIASIDKDRARKLAEKFNQDTDER